MLALGGGGCEMHKPPPSRGHVAKAGLPTRHDQEQLCRDYGRWLWNHSPFLVGWVLRELLELAHSLAPVTLI